MKIVVAGGTGFIGKPLLRALLEKGHQVILLTRDHPEGGSCLGFRPPVLTRSARAGARPEPPAFPDENQLKIVQWDPSPPPLNVRGGGREGALSIHEINGTDAVVNLAGESIAKRWTTTQKDKIRRSRVDSTHAIVSAIAKAAQKPKLLINASAVGYYGDTGESLVDESSPRGYDFLAEVCREWEEAAQGAETQDVRVVRLRFGVVLGKGGGALQKMLFPYKIFLGGPVGSGNQWFPWIHRDDVIGVILLALENKTVSGPVNVVSPEPVRQKEFSKILGKVLGRPSWLPAPAFALKILLGEMSEMLLMGQRVIPKKLVEAGYRFRYSTLEEALNAILLR